VRATSAFDSDHWRGSNVVHHDLLGLQLFKLRGANCRSLENVVFKDAFFDAAIGELHSSNAILNSFLPLAFVAGAISPVHFTVAVALVILVAPLVDVAALPSELAHTRLLVVDVASFVHVAILCIESFTPFAFSVLEAFFELTDVDASVFPFVLTNSLRPSALVGACKNITVRKDIRSLSVLQAVQPLALISVSILPLMHSVAISLRVFPLPDVRVAKDTFPDTLAFLET